MKPSRRRLTVISLSACAILAHFRASRRHAGAIGVGRRGWSDDGSPRQRHESRRHPGRGALISCDAPPEKEKKGESKGRRGKRNKRRRDGSRKKEWKERVTIEEFYEAKCFHRMKENVTFFHVGKAGGGTVSLQLRVNHIGVSGSHPFPKENKIEALRDGPSTTLVISVRDPVDRFVSAFKWRLVVLCSPEDKREAKRRGAAHDPHGKCKTSGSRREEEKMLRETYQSDPNVLARALCDGSPLRANAIEDYLAIGHSLTLSEWIEFLIDPALHGNISEKGIRNFIALPLERRGGDQTLFERHIEQLSLHLLRSRYEEETAKKILAFRSKEGEGKNREKWEHSSVRFHEANSTNVAQPPALSPLGECCLVRHLRDDYRLIRTMLGNDRRDLGKLAAVEPLVDAHPVIGKACSWGGEEQQELCTADLRSMLARRVLYLDASLGSCEEVIAAGSDD